MTRNYSQNTEIQRRRGVRGERSEPPVQLIKYCMNYSLNSRSYFCIPPGAAPKVTESFGHFPESMTQA